MSQFLASLEIGRPESNAATRSKFSRPSTLVTDFSGIGEDIVRLEEGLRRMHMNQTMCSLERLEAEGSDENEEINFKRLSQLLQQVPASLPPIYLMVQLVPISSRETHQEFLDQRSNA
jgi:hypothetical protein